MRVGLTGGSGFIGRPVHAELERRGIGTACLGRPEFDVHAAPDDVYRRAGRPDVLIHLAWGGLPNYASPHHVEVEGPAHYRFLAAMVAGGLPHLLVAGTCFEYGLQSGALGEQLTAAPCNAYGRAKDTLRRDLEAMQRQRHFGLTWARLFYLHGPGQAANSLWPSLQAAVARGDAEFPMSGGEQLRDYLPVEAAAAILVALALRRGDDGIVNVCSGRPVSVRSLVEGWIREQGWTIVPKLGRFPYPQHEPMAFWGNRVKLDRCLSMTHA